MHPIRKHTSATRRISRAGASLLLAVALPFGLASAQTPTVYHSTDPAGADPRSEAVPPGCELAAGNLVSLDFDEVEDGTPVETRYPGVTFSSVPGGGVIAHDLTGEAPPGTISPPYSLPNILATSFEGGADGDLDFFADFEPPVDGLQFLLVADNVVNAGLLTVFYGLEQSDSFLLPTDGNPFTSHLIDLSSYDDVTRFSVTAIQDQIGYDDLAWGQPEALDCVLTGGPDDEFEVWIDGGGSSSGEASVCSKTGGDGDEICAAALTLELAGIGRFVSFRPDTADPQMATLVFGEACTTVEGDCVFHQVDPPIKILPMNFLRGPNRPDPGPQRIGWLTVNSETLDFETNFTEIKLFGTAVNAKLDGLRFPPEVGSRELLADSRLIPEPGGLVQLLSGLFALAGLQRLRGRR